MRESLFGQGSIQTIQKCLRKSSNFTSTRGPAAETPSYEWLIPTAELHFF